MTLRKIDGFVVDGILEEDVRYETTVTEYPIESGGKASDHLENATPVVSMTFIVSDTPIGEVAKQRSADTIPSNEAKRYLLELRAARRPFTVEGVTGTYPLMVFASLSEPRDSESGDALVMEAEFRQLRIEEVRRATVGPLNLGHRPSRSVGGPKMWLCPDLVTIVDDETANRAKACREVVEKNGLLYFADTGKQLSLAETAQFRSHKYRARSSDQIVLQKGQLYYSEKNGRWMSADQFGNGQITKRAANQAQLRALGSKNFGVSGFSQDPRARNSYIVDSGSVPSFEGMSWAPRAPE